MDDACVYHVAVVDAAVDIATHCRTSRKIFTRLEARWQTVMN